MNSLALWQLIVMLVPLSLVAIGGVNSVLPEIHRQVVDGYGWLSDGEFADIFALAQAAPGPNIMVVGLIGWHVAGAAGMFAAMLAMCGPTSLLAYAVARLRQRDLPWLRLVERGLVPIAVGLIAASGLLLAKGTVEEATPALPLAAACTLFVWRSSRSPLWVLVAGALYGAVLL